MRATEVLAQLLPLVSNTLGVPESGIRVDASWDEYDHLESLALVELLVAIQERFGIRFQPAELRGVATVSDLAAAVERKLTGGAAAG